MKESCLQLLESRITHPYLPEYSLYGQGVALLIFNTNGDVLLGKELQEDRKYKRRQGQYNIVTETREPGELVKATVKRALREELGSDFTFFQVVEGSYRETTQYYVTKMGYPYKYRCVCLVYDGNPSVPASDIFHSQYDEIALHEWVPLDTMGIFDIEDGARMVIDYYVKQPSILGYLQ
jgi:hypothetical protein